MNLSEAIDVAIRILRHDPYGERAEAAALLQKARPFIEAAVGDSQYVIDYPSMFHPAIAKTLAAYREMLK